MSGEQEDHDRVFAEHGSAPTDPLLVTAKQLIDDANRRADQWEHEAKFAKQDLKSERDLLKSYMLDTLAITRPRDIQQTADTLLAFVFDRMNRANWRRDDDDRPPEVTRDQCAAWLGRQLDVAIAAAVKAALDKQER